MPEAFLYLGRARYALGEHGRAIEAFRRFLRGGGDAAAGLFFLGRSYLACGRPERGGPLPAKERRGRSRQGPDLGLPRRGPP